MIDSVQKENAKNVRNAKERDADAIANFMKNANAAGKVKDIKIVKKKNNLQLFTSYSCESDR